MSSTFQERPGWGGGWGGSSAERERGRERTLCCPSSVFVCFGFVFRLNLFISSFKIIEYLFYIVSDFKFLFYLLVVIVLNYNNI